VNDEGLEQGKMVVWIPPKNVELWHTENDPGKSRFSRFLQIDADTNQCKPVFCQRRAPGGEMNWITVMAGEPPRKDEIGMVGASACGAILGAGKSRRKRTLLPDISR